MKIKKIVSLLASIMLLSVVMTGCGNGGQGGQDGNDQPYIAVVAKGFQHQFWQSVKTGAEKAAADYNIKITFEGPDTEAQIDKQVDMLSSALNKNPKAICLAALDSKAVVASLQKAKDRNIPVAVSYTHLTTLLLLTVVSYIAIRIGMGYIVKRISREKVLLPILVEIAEKRVVINGLVDTGSTLRDPLNRRPVIVVESQSVKDILPEGFLDIVHQPNTEAFNTLTEEKIKVSLIPFHVLDGGGVLLGIQPDRIEINGKESGAVLALSESALSDDNSYAAIINPEAIDSLGGEET